ncbi:transcription termination factor MTERF9, chloroplastic-like [Rhododendron vialii]|uniref:transcription termination factor MTERF9, chloroplastic-like n=1 Tax=Rhododendron vialii TaxID=182163 RepID=UPI00265DDF25|nr:transcription termination factor MTERF9, chloroplastic-like [Rhododendron vialii]
MHNIIGNALHKVRSAIRNSPTHHFYFDQFRPFSSSLASTDQTPNRHSFTVNYLINSCGFPLEKAITASKLLNFETPEKPDSVIAFFRNHGFTNTQASNIIRNAPQVIVYNPEKTLLPKLEFFKSKGFSSADVVKILSKTPDLLRKSLENQIIPVFYFLKDLIGSEERTLSAIKRFAGRPLLVDLESRMAPNVDILREVGVPDVKVAFLLTRQPRTFMTRCDRFRQIVEEVKGMDFNPLRFNFVVAVHAMNSLSKLAWEKKFEVYKKWGLSENEILVAFGKYPWFMTKSEDKITRVMDFLVNKMGLDYLLVVKYPLFLSLSFEKRIVPRCVVYRALQAKGLIKKPNISIKMLKSTEMWFVQKVVNLAKEEAPELLKLYEEKLALAR